MFGLSFRLTLPAFAFLVFSQLAVAEEHTGNSSTQPTGTSVTIDCQKLINAITKRCQEKPGTKSDPEFLKEMVSLYTEKKCRTEVTLDSTGALQALAWESLSEAQKREDADTKFREWLYESNNTLSYIRNEEARVTLRELSSTSHKDLRNALTKWLDGAELDPGNKTAELYEKARIFHAAPTSPLANLCLINKNDVKVHKDYGIGAKEELAKLVIHIFLDKIRLGTDTKKLKNVPRVVQLAAKDLLSNPATAEAFASTNLQGVLQVLLNRQFENTVSSTSQSSSIMNSLPDAVEQALQNHDLMTATGNLLEPIAQNLLNHLAGNDSTPPRPVVDTTLTRGLGINNSVEFTIPSICETGDDGSTPPRITIVGKDGKTTPLLAEGWSYEIQEKGKKREILNGLYDRKSLEIDPILGLTKVRLKLPLSEMNQGERTGNYQLQIKCAGSLITYKVAIPIRSQDAKEYDSLVAGSQSPPYKEWDEDGVRRGLLVIGGDNISANLPKNHLLNRLGYKDCKETKIEMPSELFTLLAKQGKDSIDFLVKKAHANGYLQDSGVFYTYPEGVKFVCSKTVRENGKDVLHEMIILGYTKKPEEMEGHVRVDYDKFFKALNDSKRKVPVVYANMSCSSLSKCCFEISKGKHSFVKQIPTLEVVHFSTESCGPGTYPWSSVWEGLVTGKTYAEMEKSYPILQKGKGQVLLPNNPQYSQTLKTTIGRILDESPAEFSFSRDGGESHALSNFLSTHLTNLPPGIDLEAIGKAIPEARKSISTTPSKVWDDFEKDIAALKNKSPRSFSPHFIKVLSQLSPPPENYTWLIDQLVRDKNFEALTALARATQYGIAEPALFSLASQKPPNPSYLMFLTNVAKNESIRQQAFAWLQTLPEWGKSHLEDYVLSQRKGDYQLNIAKFPKILNRVLDKIKNEDEVPFTFELLSNAMDYDSSSVLSTLLSHWGKDFGKYNSSQRIAFLLLLEKTISMQGLSKFNELKLPTEDILKIAKDRPNLSLALISGLGSRAPLAEIAKVAEQYIRDSQEPSLPGDGNENYFAMDSLAYLAKSGVPGAREKLVGIWERNPECDFCLVALAKLKHPKETEKKIIQALIKQGNEYGTFVPLLAMGEAGSDALIEALERKSINPNMRASALVGLTELEVAPNSRAEKYLKTLLLNPEKTEVLNPDQMGYLQPRLFQKLLPRIKDIGPLPDYKGENQSIKIIRDVWNWKAGKVSDKALEQTIGKYLSGDEKEEDYQDSQALTFILPLVTSHPKVSEQFLKHLEKSPFSYNISAMDLDDEFYLRALSSKEPALVGEMAAALQRRKDISPALKSKLQSLTTHPNPEVRSKATKAITYIETGLQVLDGDLPIGEPGSASPFIGDPIGIANLPDPPP